MKTKLSLMTKYPKNSSSFFFSPLKKLFWLLSFTTLGCNLTLASYSKGKIYQEDMLEYVRQMKPKQIEKIRQDINLQQNIVRQMAISELVTEQAKSESFHQRSDFQLYARFLWSQKIADDLRQLKIEQLAKADDWQIPVLHLRQILLKIPASQKINNHWKPLSESEKQARQNDAFQKAQALLSRLHHGEDFIALARQYSEHPNKAQDGDMGYIVRTMLPENLWSAAIALPTGHYSDIILTAYGYHIIMVSEKISLTRNKLGDYFTAEHLLTQARHLYNSQGLDDYELNRSKESKQAIHRLAWEDIQPEQPLFDCHDLVFTKADALALIARSLNENNATLKTDIKQSKRIIAKMRDMSLWLCSADTSSQQNQSSYRYFYNELLSQQYMAWLRQQGIDVKQWLEKLLAQHEFSLFRLNFQAIAHPEEE